MASPSIHAMADGASAATEFPSTTAGLQAAIDSLAGAKGKVFIGPGTLSITTGITVTLDDVLIEGSGDGTVLSNDHATGVDIFSVTGDRCEIRNLKILGNNSTKTAGRGIDVDGDDFTADRITFDTTPDACIASGSGAANTRTTVRFCKMLSPGDSGSSDGYGVLLSSSTFGIVTGNYIYTPRSSAVFLFGDCSDTVISDNNCLSGVDNGIRWSGTTSNRVRCIGNKITGFGVDGIRAEGTNCTVVGNVSTGNTGSGIKSDGHTGGIWANNVCDSNSSVGIYLNQSTTNTDGCIISGNYCNGNTGAGIQLNSRATTISNVVVSGNICRDNTFSGIRILGASGGAFTNVSVNDNHCFSNDQEGIEVTVGQASMGAVTNLALNNNQCLTNTLNGIRIYAATTASTASMSNNHYAGNVAGNVNLAGTNWTIQYQPEPGLGTAITAAATITIPADGTTFHVTGNTNVTNGITVNTWDKGRTAVLVFEGTPTVSDTGTSNLAGNFVAAGTTNGYDTLTLCCDGTNWNEVARSTN